MLRMYRDGEDVKNIAESFGVALSYPSTLAKRMQVPLRRGGHRAKTTQAERDQMLQLYRDGVSTGDIARRFNVSVSYPSQLVFQAGIANRHAKPKNRINHKRLLAAYNSNVPVKDVADSFGVSRNYPAKLARQQHVLRQHQESSYTRQVSEEYKEAQVRDLKERGFSPMAIAALLKLPYKQVEIKLAGLQLLGAGDGRLDEFKDAPLHAP